MRATILTICGLILIALSVSAQEVTITGFPVGVGGSAGLQFFEPHRAELGAIADTLKKYPLSKAVITGSADSEKYQRNNDAMNPALALGRAHAMRHYMMSQFGADSAQLEIRTEEFYQSGPEYRFARIEVSRELADMEIRLNTIEQAPPPPAPPKEIITIKEVPTMIEQTEIKLHLGAGASTSPFGGLPVFSAAVSWDERMFLEAMVGHTFWNSDYDFLNENLNTKRRLLGGLAIYYPFEDIPIGAVGGWIRVEQMSRDYYKYVRLSEGLMVGARWRPLEFVSITGVYNPSKHHTPELDLSETKDGQFMLSATFNVSFGGTK